MRTQFHMTSLLINHLLSRNTHLFNFNTLWINPPYDRNIFTFIHPNDSVVCLDWRNFEYFKTDHLNAIFGLPDAVPEHKQVILYWPKSKELAFLYLRYLQSLPEQTPVFILSENNAGGKSIGKKLTEFSQQISKVDIAKRCTLWRYSIRHKAPSPWRETKETFNYDNSSYATYPGVFSHGKLDTGTNVLLKNIVPARFGRVLDLACGSGVIGLHLKKIAPHLEIELCDIHSMAIEASQHNAKISNLSVDIFTSDGFQNVQGRYQQIITNPPFHQGIDTDYSFASQLFIQAKKHLVKFGQLWIIANRQLPYEQWAEENSWRCELICQENGYKVLKLICHY
jgi:16S rRNA (guanine1207-N2)-methyltransferase